ncbi:MATE family efflux transporter [Marvinbryantia formatexigens]|nr:putative efflux protein, MATE family [Marvinbryantia formatexigens]
MFTNAQLRKLIFPLVMEQLLAITVGMADTMMVSQVGDAAVSGVSLVDMINVLLINIFAALATGGAVVTSQFIGKKRQDLACRSVNQLYLVSGVVSLVIMALTLIFRSSLLHLLFGSIEADVMENALIYLILSALSYPFLAIYNSGAAIFRSMGNSRITMLISMLMNAVNIIGNAILIFGCGMGAAGAATASLISRMLACVIITVLLTNQKKELHLLPGGWKADWTLIRKILYIGIPSSLENSLFQLGRVLVVSIITYFGTVQITANAIANNLDSMGILPGQAVGLAMITVVGQCVGAGDFQQAKKYTIKLLKITYAIMAAMIVCLLLLQPWILSIYNVSDEARALARTLIYIHNLCALVLWPLSFVLPNALRAANDVKYTMAVSIFSMCAFRVLFSYILGYQMGMGAIGVWIAMVIDWVFRVIMFTARFLGNKWQTHKI